jgi:membrane glycosyltransferase
MPRTIRTHVGRLLIAVLTVATVTWGVTAFVGAVSWDGPVLLNAPLVALFAVLFTWVSLWFWTATAGFIRYCAARPRPGPSAPAIPGEFPRTAVVVPVYNEDPWVVFAGIAAMHHDLRRLEAGEHFDFFVLSDTTDSRVWLEEELAWGTITDHLPDAPPVYYRRRPANAGKKSGNIADFCRRWASRYRYMIVLDADSLLSGETMLEMVKRMEADPRAGLLQVPPTLVNRASLFARLQEFAASVYGSIFTAGLGVWSGIDGNYWGHNAIIRVEAFISHCGLPRLPGLAPFGGEILSHDFVEAALLRRAGWNIHLADDLGGSYEESPATLIDFARRDQRWCQGNLQHLRVILADGLRPFSRVHLGIGVMSYLSSMLWLVFMLLSLPLMNRAAVAAESGRRVAAARTFVLLFAASMAMLLLPKLWGYLALFARPGRLGAHGGAIRAALSVLLEASASILIAPIMMVFHVTFVISSLVGRGIQWATQRRQETTTSFAEAFAAHGLHTIYGLAATLLLAAFAPGLLWWFSPLLAGLVLSIPLSMLLSSVRLGRWLSSRGLLAITEETATPRLLRRQRGLIMVMGALGRSRGRVDPFLQVIVDPGFNALHIAMLKSAGNALTLQDAQTQALQRVAFYGGPARMSNDDRLRILASEPALRWLHLAAWKHWSVATLSTIVTAPACPPALKRGLASVLRDDADRPAAA